MASTIKQEEARKRDSYIVKDLNTGDVMTVVFPNGIQTGLEGFDNRRKCTFYNETRHYGGVAVGLTGSNAQVHISAGTNSPGSAPIKFTSGSLMTTPEPGAIEYDGTDIFCTITTDSQVRRNITAKPYAAYYSTQTQSKTATPGAETIFTFNNTSYSSYVDLVSSTKIYVGYTALYNFAYSIQFDNADSAEHIASVWFKKDGNNVPGTRSDVVVPKKQSGNDGVTLLAANFFLQMASGSFAELAWNPANALVTAKTLPAGSNPTTPVSPSIVLTVNRVD